MRKLLCAATAICGLAGPAMALPAITGDINFDGSDSYNSTTVTFLGAGQGVSSGSTGALATFGTCASCITGISTTYNPFSGPVNNFLSGTNGAIHFALDLLSVFNVQFVPNNDLDFDGAAVLHLTNFADTPGEIFFSSQGPNDIEVSFSATAVPTVEPAGIAILGVGLLGLGYVVNRRRGHGLDISATA